MKLIVLLSAYNGETYIREQLDSLLAQTLRNVEILVRDDGSTDGTRAILTEYAQQGALRWCACENLGPAHSFWRLLQDAPDADYYAFCDQDDVWDSDKLGIAVSALEHMDTSKPALYFGDVRVTDMNLRILAEHMVRPAPMDYPHALLRNLAPGCTYVFNRPARSCCAALMRNALESSCRTGRRIRLSPVSAASSSILCRICATGSTEATPSVHTG